MSATLSFFYDLSKMFIVTQNLSKTINLSLDMVYAKKRVNLSITKLPFNGIRVCHKAIMEIEKIDVNGNYSHGGYGNLNFLHDKSLCKIY